MSMFVRCDLLEHASVIRFPALSAFRAGQDFESKRVKSRTSLQSWWCRMVAVAVLSRHFAVANTEVERGAIL